VRVESVEASQDAEHRLRVPNTHIQAWEKRTIDLLEHMLHRQDVTLFDHHQRRVELKRLRFTILHLPQHRRLERGQRWLDRLRAKHPCFFKRRVMGMVKRLGFLQQREGILAVQDRKKECNVAGIRGIAGTKHGRGEGPACLAPCTVLPMTLVERL
jgi:hypothetical protein